MKEVKAIVQPFMLSKVVDALRRIDGLPGMTVDTDVQGFGRNRAAAAHHKITLDEIEYAKKAKLEIVVPDELANKVVQTILKHARTGNPGDGKVFVIDVAEAYRIRTGQHCEKDL